MTKQNRRSRRNRRSRQRVKHGSAPGAPANIVAYKSHHKHNVISYEIRLGGNFISYIGLLLTMYCMHFVTYIKHCSANNILISGIAFFNYHFKQLRHTLSALPYIYI